MGHVLPHCVSEAQVSKGERDGLSEDPLANGSVIVTLDGRV